MNRAPDARWTVVLAALAAGCTTTDDRYGVDAFAELVPLPDTTPRVTGRLEVLSPAQRDDSVEFARVVAAHRVELPAGSAPWIRLWVAPSCAPQDEPMTLYQDLGLIRQVDDDVHFFDRNAVIAGHTVDVDVGTAIARVTLDPASRPGVTSGRLFDLIAVAQAPGDPHDTTTELSSGRNVPTGGAWLACGTFVSQ